MGGRRRVPRTDATRPSLGAHPPRPARRLVVVATAVLAALVLVALPSMGSRLVTTAPVVAGGAPAAALVHVLGDEVVARRVATIDVTSRWSPVVLSGLLVVLTTLVGWAAMPGWSTPGGGPRFHLPVLVRAGAGGRAPPRPRSSSVAA